MGHFPVRPAQIKLALRKGKIPLRLVLGEKDEFIKREEALRFTRNIEQAQCIIIPTDHRLISAETAVYF